MERKLLILLHFLQSKMHFFWKLIELIGELAETYATCLQSEICKVISYRKHMLWCTVN